MNSARNDVSGYCHCTDDDLARLRALIAAAEKRDRLEALDRLEAQLGVKVHLWREDNAVKPEELAAALRIVTGVNALPSDRYSVQHIERHLEQATKGFAGFADAIAGWTNLVKGKAS